MWLTPSGKYIIADLPKEVQSTHFGPGVKQYIVHQAAKNRVTQDKIRQDLNDKGIQISKGQIDTILKIEAQALQVEKDAILYTGLRHSEDVRTDDTGARHQGKNGYCTVIQNDLFTYFRSTDSKSRINFFEILRGNRVDYIIHGDSFEYLEKIPLL